MLFDPLRLILGVGLAIVFLTSAGPKLRYPKSFLFAVLDYRAAPPRLARIFATVLPAVECFTGLTLLSGVVPVGASVLAALLLVVFIYAVALNLGRGRSFDCNCSGVLWARRVGIGLLLQDCSLVGAAVTLGALSLPWPGRAPWSPVWRVASGSLVAIVGVVVACAVLSVVAARVLPLAPSLRRYISTGLGASEPPYR